jgi:hypothetical protein
LFQVQLKRVAVAGDRTTWAGLVLEVIDTDGPHIARVLVTVASDRPLEESDGS